MTTPDRHPGPIVEDEEILLQPNATPPTQPGAFAFDGTSFQFKDSVGVFDPRTGGIPGLTYIEFLLDNEPTVETGATDCSYTVTYTTGKVTKEEWFRNDTTLIKSIDFTYTGGEVTTEVRKVFAANGTTIVAQVTWNYTYSGGRVTSATMIRDV